MSGEHRGRSPRGKGIAERLAASAAALAPYAILDTAPEAEFDDLVQLVRTICDVPTALLSLFDNERLWMKARVGFEQAQTRAADSICIVALDEPDILILPDLTADPRTADNVHVRAPDGLRFYAGMPLRLADGTIVGTLCAIDTVPRPGGLDARQREGMRALARQAVAQLTLRRLANERAALLAAREQENRRLRDSEAALSANAAQWRGVFTGLREGFMIAELIRAPDGSAIDWRHLEINASFLATIDQPREKVIGHTIRELSPDVATDLVAFVAGVVDSGEPAAFDRQIGGSGRQFEGRVFPIGHEQFAVLFIDVTKRNATIARQTALIAVSDRLRDLDRLEDMTAAVSAIVGETLGAARAGYGRLDQARETITMEPDWTMPGVDSIAGVHRFADYGDLLNELLVGEPLVIDDVTTDPRSARDPGPMLAIGIGALINIPVRERGRTVAVFFVHSRGPRRWTREELAFLRDVADRVELAVVRLRVENQRVLQNRELSHRLKNTLAMVQAIASQTLKPLADRSVVDTFERRLTALASAHDVLLASDWRAAPLADVILAVFEAVGQEGRVRLAGPIVPLSPRAALSISLVMHELATNAIKYGALSVAAGRVEIGWRIEHGDQAIVRLEWRECDGPPAAPPLRRGFGSRLINMGLVGTGGVTLDYPASGVVAHMAAPLDDLIKQ